MLQIMCACSGNNIVDVQQQDAVDVNAAVHASLLCLSQGCVMYLARWLTAICYEVVVLGHLDIKL